MTNACKAPDCDERAEWPRKYCSTVCMNVGLEVAAARVGAWIDDDGVPDVEDLSDETIAEIREQNERTHEQINRQIENHD